MRVKIHREGTNILILLLFILAVVNASAWMFIRPVEVPVVFSTVSAVVYFLVVNFFVRLSAISAATATMW